MVKNKLQKVIKKEIEYVKCNETYCKKHYINYRELVKVGNKVEAFITQDEEGSEFSYAFGKPSQKSYLSFRGKENNKLTLEDCRKAVSDIINKRIETVSNIINKRIEIFSI